MVLDFSVCHVMVWKGHNHQAIWDTYNHESNFDVWSFLIKRIQISFEFFLYEIYHSLTHYKSLKFWFFPSILMYVIISKDNFTFLNFTHLFGLHPILLHDMQKYTTYNATSNRVSDASFGIPKVCWKLWCSLTTTLDLMNLVKSIAQNFGEWNHLLNRLSIRFEKKSLTIQESWPREIQMYF